MATCPTCRAQFSDDANVCPNDGEALLPDEAFAQMDADLKPGETVGEYKVESKLGEGGFGAVYRAVHPLIGKTCAIKVLNRQYSSNPQMVSRFIAEARAVNQIRHRNIIDIFSFGALADGRQYFVMELLEGMPFDAYLDQQGKLDPEQALPILRSVARALDAAHQAGIVHRDLKPENVFLVFDEDGGVQPKLLDFGIAKLLTDPSGGHKTRTGTPMGTPNYMSPEQCRGQKVDHRTDVYSFGCVCHQVLTGTLPFDGEGIMDVLVKHMTVAPPKMSDVNPALRPELDEPVQRMLAKTPDQRPQSVGSALDELLRAAKGAGYAVPGGAAITGVSAPSLSRPQATTGSKLTPAEMELSQAKTMAHATSAAPSEPARGKTFAGQATDVAAKPRRTAVVALAGLGLAAVLGVGAVVATQRTGGTNGGAGAATPTAPASTVLAATTAAPAVTSAAAPAASSAAVAVAPATVDITIDAMPAGVPVTVFSGAQKVGTAPGPITLPYATAKTTLTFKADGYAPATADVVPTENRTVSITLQKQLAPQGGAKPATTKKDYESPF